MMFDFEFFDAEQEHFFREVMFDLGTCKSSTEESVYLLSIVPEMRFHFWDIFGFREQAIVNECSDAKWQTDTTRRLISMARKLEHTQN